MLLQGRRIFIVEDDLANRAIEQILLEQAGAKTAFERWGTATIERLRRFMPVDVILLDLMFPNEITGYDIFSDIRSHPEFRHVPVVAVSASDPSTAVPKSRAYGFAGFIHKPVSFDLFAEQVETLIQGQPVWQGH